MVDNTNKFYNNEEGIWNAMKRKILTIMLAAVITLSAAACTDEKQESGSSSQSQTDNKDEKEGDTQSAAEQVSYDIDKCVKLGDYSNIKISLENDYKVTKAQVDEYALSAAESNAQPVYRDTDKKKVEDGDIVNIDYEGKKDGVAFQGGTSAGYHLTIGSNSFIDGFEEGLIGAKVGDTVELNLTFPEGYPSQDLAGEDVVFTVKVNKIVEPDPDAKFELNDEYVQQNTEFQTVKEYKENVRQYLESSSKSDKERDTRQAVIDKLMEICEVTMPQDLLDARVSDYVIQYTNNNCKEGQSLTDFLAQSYNGMTEEDFRADIKSEMEVNLETELILEAIVKKEKMELDEEAFKKFVQEQMSTYGYESEEDFYKSNGVNAKAGEAYEKKVYVCNRALDMVVENASVKYGVSSKKQDDAEK